MGKTSQKQMYRIKFVNIYGIGAGKLREIREDLIKLENEYLDLSRTKKITFVRHLYVKLKGWQAMGLPG